MMPERLATSWSVARPRSRAGLTAVMGFGAFAIALFALPLLSVAENRLALGRPVFGAEVLGGNGALVLAAVLTGLIFLILELRRWAPFLAVAAFAFALLLFADALGQGAARSLGGLAPAARASLGGGAWLTLGLLGFALGLAIQRTRAMGVGLAVGIGLILAIGMLGHAGRFKALSLAVEYGARRDTVDTAILDHLVLSGAAVALALVVAILLSLWRRGQGFVAILVAGIQVVPAVALLGALVGVTAGLLRAAPTLREFGLSALGAVPAVVAIAAYLLLPLWRGLALALHAADPVTLEAAHALGFTPRQTLVGIRLPLGAPILVGALRVAAVQSLGLATLGALVGAGGLGRIVFDGMAQFAPDLILLGAIPVVALSLGAEMGLSRLESAARQRWHA